ncbi:PaaI family thioesterase [Solihabitans fulvus]|uniref:PaaI family thioesterase n=2 Tax=Solihabitans fulvus TaxID=1892852 RepID=A0A5B2WVC9_9PSEU|nr:PaaI family thioesterase [Solihabitans fulvus]
MALLDGLQLMQSIHAQSVSVGIGAVLGMAFDEVEDGRVAIVLSTRPELANPLGTLHGGVAATMLDSAMGCAVHTTLAAGVGYTSLDLAVKFLRPGPLDGTVVRAEGRVVHRGRQVVTGEGTLTDARGRLLATATTTCLVLPPGRG